MPSTIRKRYSANFKAQVAFQACSEQKTLQQLASEHKVCPGQISQWKKQLKSGALDIFAGHKRSPDIDKITAPLYQQIGQLKVELDWLKKKSTQ